MKQKGLAPILLIILLAALALGGFLIYQKQTKPASSSQQITQPSPTKTDETVYTEASRSANPDSIGANWKTYTSADSNYSIKYPADFQIQTFPNRVLTGHSEQKYTLVNLNFPKDNDNSFNTRVINIAVTDVPLDISIPEAIEKSYSGVGGYQATKFKSTDFNDVIVDGVYGLGNEAPARFNAYDVHVIKKNRLFAFRVESYKDLSISTMERKTFDQILSTFKFLP